ncbi:hypothetical protein D9M70_377870 [compost metagenome]
MGMWCEWFDHRWKEIGEERPSPGGTSVRQECSVCKETRTHEKDWVYGPVPKWKRYRIWFLPIVGLFVLYLLHRYIEALTS